MVQRTAIPRVARHPLNDIDLNRGDVTCRPGSASAPYPPPLGYLVLNVVRPESGPSVVLHSRSRERELHRVVAAAGTLERPARKLPSVRDRRHDVRVISVAAPSRDRHRAISIRLYSRSPIPQAPSYYASISLLTLPLAVATLNPTPAAGGGGGRVGWGGAATLGSPGCGGPPVAALPVSCTGLPLKTAFPSAIE